MLGNSWIVPALPLLGFLLLAAFGRWLPRWLLACIGVGSVGAAALATTAIAIAFAVREPVGGAFVSELWTFLDVPPYRCRFVLYWDALSLIMALVVTWVAFLIHLYSVEFMRQDEGFVRFFATMNLFVGSMLLLILAGDLLFMLLGWEGVGLCSYLLIGFWYREPENTYAARKAFIVTRIGDTSLLIGLLLLTVELGTLETELLMNRVGNQWASGSLVAELSAGLVLGGALGKSAQLPLQTWLPDAMAGPTPVSALIHAATMVTAGVYLIARTHVLFALAPRVALAIAIIGATTLLLAGFAALVQRDIKRVLAYSTISQLGYMFLALGVGAWTAAIFHLVTHAFFKSLLFLGAGAVSMALHHEYDLFRMGGLRSKLPLTFWTFLIGSASLAGLPLVTAGFFSKDLILWQTLSSPQGGQWLWAMGMVGVFLTSFYVFRVVFLAFFGAGPEKVERSSGWLARAPLLVLAALALTAGYLETPHFLGGVHLFSSFLGSTLPPLPGAGATSPGELTAQTMTAGLSVLGVLASAHCFLGRRRMLRSWSDTAAGRAIAALLRSGWGFDWLYHQLLVRPLLALATLNRRDFVDLLPTGLGRAHLELYGLFARSETGRVRSYAAGMACGAVIMIALAVWL